MRFIITGVKPGNRLTAIRDNTKADPRRVLAGIGRYQVAKAQKAFRDQGRPANSWKARAVPNIPGIIQNQGRVLQRHLRDRPALHGTGALKKSIAWQHIGRDRVGIGSALPYASQHQFGDKNAETEVVTKQVQDNLSDWLYRGSTATKPGENYRQWGKQLQWLLDPKLQGQRLPWRIRARPFIEVKPEDVKAWAELLGVEVVKADA